MSVAVWLDSILKCSHTDKIKLRITPNSITLNDVKWTFANARYLQIKGEVRIYFDLFNHLLYLHTWYLLLLYEQTWVLHFSCFTRNFHITSIFPNKLMCIVTELYIRKPREVTNKHWFGVIFHVANVTYDKPSLQYKVSNCPLTKLRCLFFIISLNPFVSWVDW